MILFVDDELARIDPILATFENAGIEVRAVTNGVDCLSFFESNVSRIELIIVDLLIPYGEKSVRNKYSGIELITDIQELNSSVPIIVYTNVPSNELRDSLKGLDIKKMVRKCDVTPLEFLGIVKEYIVNQNNNS